LNLILRKINFIFIVYKFILSCILILKFVVVYILEIIFE